MGRATRGVALLEVLLSVSILAFGMGIALRAISTCTRTQSRTEDRATARRLAEQQLTTLRLQGRAALQGEMTGRFDEAFADYSWSARIHSSAEDVPFVLIAFKVWKGRYEDRRLVYTANMLVG